MKAVALNLMKFFEDESCGQCTPCRVGTEKAAKLMEQGPWDPALLTELSTLMRDASICGLGQAAPNPLLCVLKFFPDELTKPHGALVRKRLTMSDARHAQKPNTFFIDDREVDIREGETIFRAARRLDIKLPHLCYSPKPGYRPDGNCRVCMVEIEGERVLAASCIRTPAPGMKVKTQTDRAKTARKMVAELLLTDQPAIEVAHDPDSELWKIVNRQKLEAGRFPKRDAIKVPRARPQPCGDGGQPRRLHPVQSLRPRLPRSAGQRRDRHGRPRPSREDRVRLRRPDGRVDLRRLRRMRAGLPDRRADAVDHGRREQRLSRQARPHGGQRLPVLRRRLPAHLPDQGRQDRRRRGQERPGQPEPALRQGPLRLRLRRQSAAPAEADDPQGRRAEGAARVHRPVEPVDAFPRGDLGGGARPRRRGPEENPRPRRPRRAGRLRLGQGLERRGVSVPEAGPHRLRHQQRRSLHAALPRLVGVGAARRRRLGRRHRDLQRVQELRSHHRDRREPDREPSGRRDLLQAGGQARRQARGDGPARPGAEAPRLEDDAVQERHRRCDAQRHAERHRRGKALRPAIHPDLRRGLRRLEGEHQGLHAGGDGADLRHRGRHAA